MLIISNKNIDKKLWNQKLLALGGKSIPPYGFAEYLDVVNPKWKIIWDDETNTYVPLTIQGLFQNKLTRAPFCQQLPVLSNKSTDQITDFLKQSFTGGQIGLQLSGNAPNYILNLEHSYDSIISSFNTNRKRALKKVLQSNLEVSSGSSIEPGIQLMNESGPVKLSRKESVLLRKISTIKSEHIQPVILEVKDDNEICSQALFLKSPNRITYIFGSSSGKGQKDNAPTLLFNEVVKTHCSNPYILDFEGSKTEGVAKFYQSLGGTLEPYNLLSVK